jgi:hypothetical protein
MSLLPEFWPKRLHTVLLDTYGAPLHIELLTEGHAVWRVQSAKQSVIVKRSTQPRESIFYTMVAPTLATVDIPIPHLEWSGRDAESFWLVLEDIPTPLPRVRWSADQEMLTVLHRLHQRLPLNLNLAFPSFEPEWSDTMTNDALACFPSVQARRLAPILQDLRLSHQTLFAPQCWICKSRLSSRHDSGLKSGIVFDENDTQAPQANESPLTCLTKTRLELFCCREHFSFHTQGDGFFPTQTVRRTPQVEDLAMMKQAINNRHH